MYAFIGGTIGRIPWRKAPQGSGLQDLQLPADLAAQYVIYSCPTNETHNDMWNIDKNKSETKFKAVDGEKAKPTTFKQTNEVIDKPYSDLWRSKRAVDRQLLENTRASSRQYQSRGVCD